MNKDRQYMIFKNEYGRYSVGLSKKDKDENYIKAYFPVKFKKGVEIQDKTRILVKDAWFDFYNYDYEGKKGTSFYFFINDFVEYKEEPEGNKPSKVDLSDNVFKEFSEEIDTNNLDLPF